jgi:hypothetical protein
MIFAPRLQKQKSFSIPLKNQFAGYNVRKEDPHTRVFLEARVGNGSWKRKGGGFGGGSQDIDLIGMLER